MERPRTDSRAPKAASTPHSPARERAGCRACRCGWSRSSQAENLSDGLAQRLALRRLLGFLQLQDRVVEDLVDELRGELLDRSALFGRHRPHPAQALLQLVRADVFETALQFDDGRDGVLRDEAAAEAFHFALHDLLGLACLLPAQLAIGVSNLLQVINVVEVRTVDRRDLRIDVARN